MKKILLILPIILIISYFFLATAPVVLAQQCNCLCDDNKTCVPNMASRTACETHCNNLGNHPGGVQIRIKDCVASCPEVGVTTPQDRVTLVDPLGIGAGGGPEELYARVIIALLSFVGIASLVTFVYAGFIFLISAGNPERVKKAKDTMIYAAIGVVIAIASYAILSFVFKALETATGNV